MATKPFLIQTSNPEIKHLEVQSCNYNTSRVASRVFSFVRTNVRLPLRNRYETLSNREIENSKDGVIIGG